jgi:subtilisin family serine protease
MPAPSVRGRRSALVIRDTRRKLSGVADLGVESLESRVLLAADTTQSLVTPSWFKALLPTPSPTIRSGIAPATSSSTAARVQGVDSLTHEWIVRLSDKALKTIGTVAEAATALANPGLGVQVVKGLGLTGQLLVRSSGAAPAVTGYLKSSPLIAYAELNGTLRQTASVPNDPSYIDGSLWGLHNTGQSGGKADADIDAPEAWQITTGSDSVVVAVIDTGIDINHPDLRDNIWVNPGETAGDGIDNDGNGFIDDVHGWDFANNDASVYDGPDDDHGTHVAGTIAGRGNNGTGVVGVSWNTKIMSLKFLDPYGSTSDAIAAVNYATMMKSRGTNLRITSNSWGGGGYSKGLKDAIDAGGQSDILFVAAAGNDGLNNDALPTYPASYESTCIIAVAATDRNEGLAGFSNYGKTSVDIGAPGVSILSTLPGNTYGSLSGTSMATPHVSGVAALAVAFDPNISVSELKSAILGGVEAIPSLANKTVTGGRLNARNTLDLVRPSLKLVSADPAGRVAGPVSTITLTFSQTVESSAVVAANFLLKGDGDDGAFGTADDVSVTISKVEQTVPGTVVLTVATPLASAERYALTLKGTGTNPLRTPQGRPLTKAGGAAAATDLTHGFTVRPAQTDSNESLAGATVISKTFGVLAIEATIGDGTFKARDIDLYRVALTAGQTLTVDINARSLPESSRLDSVVRIFDASGRQIVFNDDDGVTLDSFVRFTATATSNYFVGVSGYGNLAYRAEVAGTGSVGATGDYQIVLGFSGALLLADVIDVTPDPRDRDVETITVRFNRPVNGFDVGDLSLSRNGMPVTIGAATLVSTDDRTTWVVGGTALRAATSQTGNYRLTVNAIGRGIADDVGTPFVTAAVDEWKTVVPPPTPPTPPTPKPPLTPDVGDTLSTAGSTAALAVGKPFFASGRIGDGDQRSRDVDFFKVVIAAGQSLSIDVDAQTLAQPSPLDSVVRLFRSNGSLVAANDNDSRPGKASRDSYLEVRNLGAGTYYLGISGVGNAGYTATTLAGRNSGSLGTYSVTIGLSGPAAVAPSKAAAMPSTMALAFAALTPQATGPATGASAKKRF